MWQITSKIIEKFLTINYLLSVRVQERKENHTCIIFRFGSNSMKLYGIWHDTDFQFYKLKIL